MGEGVGTLGINPDAFGVWYADGSEGISWREFLDGTSDAGFATVELGPYGFLPTDASELSEALQERSLGLTGGYVVGPFHEEASRDAIFQEIRQVCTTTKVAGAQYLLLLASARRGKSGRQPLESDNWRAMISGLLEAASIVSDEFGLIPVYHPHVGLAVETAEETERLVQDTQGELGICLDSGQFAFPGGDPAMFLRCYGELVEYLHLRDLDSDIRDKCVADGVEFRAAAEAGVFCEPGEGEIDFSGLLAAANEANFDGPVIVERSLIGATTHQAVQAACRAYEFYRDVGFGK